MNLKENIPSYYSQIECNKIVDWINGSPERFSELMDIFFESNTRKNQYASGVMIHCIDRWGFLIIPYIEKLIVNLQNDGLHDAIKRNTVRVLQDVEIPENLHGITAEICFSYLKNPAEAVAIKVFSMTILHNLTKYYPELKDELHFILEEQYPFQSAGFKSRA
ncbi:MAG: hypothetical protein MUF58_10665, partial [Arcicella sp.]|nr:hypothetical protein [Arcicella sp.]